MLSNNVFSNTIIHRLKREVKRISPLQDAAYLNVFGSSEQHLAVCCLIAYVFKTTTKIEV